MALAVKKPPASAGDVKASGRSPGEGNGSPLQYSCLENPMDRGAWWAPVHGVMKSWTRLKQLRTDRWNNTYTHYTYMICNISHVMYNHVCVCVHTSVCVCVKYVTNPQWPINHEVIKQGFSGERLVCTQPLHSLNHQEH